MVELLQLLRGGGALLSPSRAVLRGASALKSSGPKRKRDEGPRELYKEAYERAIEEHGPISALRGRGGAGPPGSFDGEMAEILEIFEDKIRAPTARVPNSFGLKMAVVHTSVS